MSQSSSEPTHYFGNTVATSEEEPTEDSSTNQEASSDARTSSSIQRSSPVRARVVRTGPCTIQTARKRVAIPRRAAAAAPYPPQPTQPPQSPQYPGEPSQMVMGRPYQYAQEMSWEIAHRFHELSHAEHNNRARLSLHSQLLDQIALKDDHLNQHVAEAYQAAKVANETAERSLWWNKLLGGLLLGTIVGFTLAFVLRG